MSFLPQPGGQPNRRPRLPRPEVSTSVQLGVATGRILGRGVVAACPVCGSRHLFRRWFSMAERCPSCDFRFERVEGHWIGSLGLNTIVSFGALLLVLAAGTALAFPEMPEWPVLAGSLAVALLMPFLFFPTSRTLWTAIDLLMRPLRPGEVDPRFVLVDPGRDAPEGP